MSKSEIEAKIEFQEEIGEANPGGYQPVKFSRVKSYASKLVIEKAQSKS